MITNMLCDEQEKWEYISMAVDEMLARYLDDMRKSIDDGSYISVTRIDDVAKIAALRNWTMARDVDETIKAAQAKNDNKTEGEK